MNYKLNRKDKIIASVMLVAIISAFYGQSLVSKTTYIATEAAQTVLTPIATLFFGDAVQTAEAASIIDKQVELVSTRKVFDDALAVVKKHEDTIKQSAADNNVPEDVAIGVALLENGGSDTAVSSAGATGVFQLMKGTAKNLGLTVNRNVDERKNPDLNIRAGVKYLSENYARFGDWGLATWAYHAGEGNVTKAIQIYARSNDSINLPGVGDDSGAVKSYVSSNEINIHKLLSDPQVKQFAEKLHDDSIGYPFKVIATAELYRDSD